MNLLELIPSLEGIIGKVIQDPNQAGNLKLELEKLDVQKDIEKMKVQQAWLSNKSVYVAGAIPTILWLLSAVVAFNHILAPLLTGMGMTLPILELPKYYTDLAGTIVLGLFAKKAWDSSTITTIGKIPKMEEPIEVSTTFSRDDPEYHEKRFEEILNQYGMYSEKE